VTGETAGTSSTYVHVGVVTLTDMTVAYADSDKLGSAWVGAYTYTGQDCVTAVAS